MTARYAILPVMVLFLIACCGRMVKKNQDRDIELCSKGDIVACRRSGSK